MRVPVLARPAAIRALPQQLRQ